MIVRDLSHDGGSLPSEMPLLKFGRKIINRNLHVDDVFRRQSRYRGGTDVIDSQRRRRPKADRRTRSIALNSSSHAGR